MIQTWLPLPDFKDSLAALNPEHLLHQQYHVLELVEYFHQPEDSQLPISYNESDLDDESPIVKMWRGYELQLIEYGLEAADEWDRRRYPSHKMQEKLMVHMEWAATEDAEMSKPNWFGDIEFHLGHQGELLRLDYSHYSTVFVRDGQHKLVWPVSDHA